MRVLLSLALLFVALSACEPPLPPGAYLPDTSQPPDIPWDASTVQDSGVAAPPIGGGSPGLPGVPGAPGGPGAPDAMVDPVGTGGVVGGQDGGGGLVGGSDSGVPQSELAQKLKKLEGNYFMRMDMLSKATVSASFLQVRTSNRISHLLVTKLVAQGETLIGYERMCHQTFQHRCDRECTTLTTQVHPNMTALFSKMGDAERYYTFNGGNLTTNTTQMLFGFDGTSNKSLPNSTSDGRVWDPVAGGLREGLLMKLVSTGGLASVNCNVYTVQDFTSEFSGPAALGTELTLSNRSFTLTTSGDAKTLGADRSNCQPSGSDNGSTTDEGQTVRFAKVELTEFDDNALFACPPASAWDRLTPSALP